MCPAGGAQGCRQPREASEIGACPARVIDFLDSEGVGVRIGDGRASSLASVSARLAAGSRAVSIAARSAASTPPAIGSEPSTVAQSMLSS